MRVIAYDDVERHRPCCRHAISIRIEIVFTSVARRGKVLPYMRGAFKKALSTLRYERRCHAEASAAMRTSLRMRVEDAASRAIAGQRREAAASMAGKMLSRRLFRDAQICCPPCCHASPLFFFRHGRFDVAFILRLRHAFFRHFPFTYYAASMPPRLPPIRRADG